MINSFFIDIAYPLKLCEDYCKQMAQAGMASDNLNCNIIMWWDGEDYAAWNVLSWVNAHDRNRLYYGLDTGFIESDVDCERRAKFLKGLGFLTSSIYINNEYGTAFFGASAYASYIKIFDKVCQSERYFISPYTNALGLQAAKRVHKEAVKLSKSTDALIVICPQDGVGACKYPGSPVSSSNRYPGKAGFRKVQQFFKYLHGMGNDRVIYRVNCETFQWKSKPADKSRVQAQVAAFGPYSTGGVGPSWCFYPEMIGV